MEVLILNVHKLGQEYKIVMVYIHQIRLKHSRFHLLIPYSCSQREEPRIQQIRSAADTHHPHAWPSIHFAQGRGGRKGGLGAHGPFSINLETRLRVSRVLQIYHEHYFISVLIREAACYFLEYGSSITCRLAASRDCFPLRNGACDCDPTTAP